MQVFDFRERLIRDYASYIESFIQIQDLRIHDHVRQVLDDGTLWPQPLIQLNPSFEPGDKIDDLVGRDILHPDNRTAAVHILTNQCT